MKLIAIEEHFLWGKVAAEFGAADRALVDPARIPGLDELGDIRIRATDEAGIDMQVLSLNKPGVQEIAEQQQAIDVAQASNDLLAEAVARHLPG